MQRVVEQPKPCATCGTMIQRKRYSGVLENLKKFNERKYCSRTCGNTRSKVGDSMLCKRARKHLKTNCEVCSSDYMLAAHHKDKNRENNTSENIQTLCVRCHAKFHHGTL